MTKQAGPVTIAFVLAALTAPARAQAVEGSTQVEQEPHRAGEGRVGHTGADFYRDLDRPDLAERYERRLGWKYLGGFVGGAAMAAGLVWGAIDLFNTDWQNNFRCCGSAKPIGGAHASPYPWITAGAGLGLLIVSVAAPTDPLTVEERIELINVYNRKVTLLPRLEPDGADLMLAGRF